MADDDDESLDSGESPFTSALEAGMTSTPEAHEYARALLNRELTEPVPAEDEDLIHELQTNSDTARSVLQNARQRILSLRYDPDNALMKLSVGSALTSPTPGMTFAGGLGNAAKAAAGQLEARRQFGEGQADTADQLGLQLAHVNDPVIQAKLGLAKLQQQQNAGLAGRALTTLARPELGGRGNTAGFDQVLLEGGVKPGSPEWVQAHKDLATKMTHVATPASMMGDYQLTPQDLHIVHEIRHYNMAPPSGMGSNTPRWMAIRAALDEPDEDGTIYQASNWPVIQRARNDFTSGQGSAAGSITALNTAINHMDTLREILAGFKQGQYPKVNQLLNTMGYHVGTTNKPSAEFLAQLLSGEVMKTVNSTAGGEGEREEMGKQFAPLLNNPKQMEDLLDKATAALAGKLEPLHQRFTQTGWSEDDPRFGWNSRLSPAAHAAIWYSQHPDASRQRALDILKSDPDSRAAFIKHYGNPPPGFAKGGSVDPYADPYGLDQKETKPHVAAPVASPSTGDPYAPAAPTGPKGSTVGNVVRALEQGATAKWGDELNAGVESATGHGSYSQDVANERGDLADLSSEHPAVELGSEIAGGAAPAAAGLAALRGLSKLHGEGKLGAVERLLALASRFAPDSKRAARVLQLAGSGAVAGGVAGAGANTDPDRIGLDTAEGAGIGAVTGPLGGLAARYGVAAPVAAIRNRLTGQAASAGQRAIAGGLGSDPQGALTSIEQRLASDRAAGVPSSIGEAAPPQVRAVGNAAVQRGTPAGQVYAAQATERQATAPGRVSDLVNKGLTPDPYLQHEKDLTTALYQNAKPLYEKAYAQFPSVQSPALNQLLGTPAGKSAARLALRMMQNEGIQIGDADATGMVQRPSLQFLDYVKRAYDDMITRAEGSGPNYAPTNEGRILRGQRASLLSDLDESTKLPNGTSPYQQARAQYAGDLEVRDALRSGRDEFDSMTPEELQQRVGGMSYAEKDAFRSGVAENLFQKLRTSGAGSNPAQRIIGQRGMQDKLGALFDDPGKSRQFIQGLKREMQLYNGDKETVGAGAAGAASNAEDSLENPLRQGLETFARHGFGPATGQLIKRVVGEGPASDQVATILSKSGKEALPELQRLRQAVAGIASRNRTLGTGTSIGSAALAPAEAGLTEQGEQ